MPNGNEAKQSGNKWAIMGGIALNVEYTRKYGFEVTAAARVTARLVAIPPPLAFQEAIQADVAGRQKRATLAAAPTFEDEGQTPLVLPSRQPPAETVIEAEEVAWSDDDESLSLLVPDAAGVAYTLDDGVNPPSAGQVSADGILIHRISAQAERVMIWFANRAEPVICLIEQRDVDEIGDFADDELLEVEQFAEDDLDEAGLAEAEADEAELDEDERAEDWDEERFEDVELDDVDAEDEQSVEELVALSSEDDTPTLSLMVPDKANQPFTLDDGINPPSDGVVDETGLLIHPVAPDATGASLKFADETDAIQFSFATE